MSDQNRYIVLFIFAIAIVHSFLVSPIEIYSRKFKKDSYLKAIFHYLAEVEVVFGLWSLILFTYLVLSSNFKTTLAQFNLINFTEAKFVFVIMLIAGTKPIIKFSETLLKKIATFLPFEEKFSFYISVLVLGPLLGSLITEPAAMTVVSLILLETFYENTMSLKFKYATLALMFVNVSVGGTLTHFAAPPVVMVASKWNWDLMYMLDHFGYKSVIAVIISTFIYALTFKNELKGPLLFSNMRKQELKVPYFVISIHIIFLILAVNFAHSPDLLFGLLVFFIAFVNLTSKYQSDLKFKEALLVGFFLSGLIYLGHFQEWWIKDLLLSMNENTINISSTLLTAITDNALITYLGSLVPLTESAKYALMTGAVTGGGLTVIANAPNPVGMGILREKFGVEGVSTVKLFLWALIPTVISSLCFYFLPSLNF